MKAVALFLCLVVPIIASPSTPSPSALFSARGQSQCRTTLETCTEMVQPYLNNAAYMFPTSLEAVNEMCKMWSTFVDCIRKYIAVCFEENRRILFHKSVENSIDTVHAICSSKVYQNEYLKKATCFKQVSMDHCGHNYRTLVDVISNRNANDEHICCAYAQFKQCVNRPLLEDCGRKAKNLMDHSMSFLITRCNHYSYQTRTECPRLEVLEAKNVEDDDGVEVIMSRARGVESSEETVSEPPESSTLVSSETSSPSSSSTTSTLDPELLKPAIKPLEERDSVDGSDSETIVYTLRPESQMSYTSGSNACFSFFNSLATLLVVLYFFAF